MKLILIQERFLEINFSVIDTELGNTLLLLCYTRIFYGNYFVFKNNEYLLKKFQTIKIFLKINLSFLKVLKGNKYTLEELMSSSVSSYMQF